MTAVPDLQSLRRELDDVDRGLVELIARRLRIVASVAEAKAHTSTPVRDLQRERAVLAGVEARAAQLGVAGDLVRRVFREIIGHAVDLQAAELIPTSAGHVTVGFQGVENAYSHLAARKHITGRGENATYVGHASFAEVLEALRDGRCDLAVLPIEDTTAGSINQVYDLLQHSDVAVVGEETWRVDHCLAAVADVPLSAVTHVVSHPRGLDQCATFLRTLPNVTPVHCFDTAEAMRTVAERGDPAYAAIGAPEAADAHGLAILRRAIADSDENYTRFLVLAAKPAEVGQRVPAKTSLILTTRHEEGALLRCLEILAGSGHSMTKLESRPKPGRPFEYLFFLDFEGNLAEPRTRAVVDELRSAALYVKVLGSYPAKVTRADPRLGQLPPPAEGIEAVVVPPPAPTTRRPRRLVDRDARDGDTLVRVGDVLVGADGFVVLAGPETVGPAGGWSAHQLRTTARAVRDAGGHVLRAGVFGPGTGPEVGWDALARLSDAGRLVGLPIATEVTAVEQVARTARIVDLLQVGARNMQNFDLLRALGRVDRPVLLERGMSSTIEEWLAAAEYVLSAGNQQVIMCERGIRTFEAATRNTLDLSAVPVVRDRTHLPVVVDPSHGGGRHVIPVARAARAVGCNGLLLGVTPDPGTGDGLDLAGFAALMGALG